MYNTLLQTPGSGVKFLLGWLLEGKRDQAMLYGFEMSITVVANS